MNPYAELGLTAAATPAQIRAAYRRLSKTSHPDAGGDPVAFERLKLAHDVLMDPERRAKFDATGEVDLGTADNAHGPVALMLGAALAVVMGQIEASGRVATSVDLVKELLLFLKAALDEIVAQRAKTLKIQSGYRKILGRFTVTDGSNLIEGIIRARVAEGDQVLAMLASKEAVAIETRDFLKKYGFRMDLMIASAVETKAYAGRPVTLRWAEF